MKLIPKKIFCVILFLFVLVGMIAQSVFDDYEKKIIKKNRIKKKTHWVYGTQASTGYKGLEVTYNERGDIIQEISYRSTGKIAVKRDFKYDSKGNIIEYQNYDGKRGKVTYKKFVKYDSNGKKMIESGFDGVDTFENKFSYDSRGRLQEIRYYISGKLVERRQMTYKDNKQEIVIYKMNNVLSEKLVKFFDENNNVIKDISYTASGGEKKKVIYSYDTKGNILNESKYYSGNMTEKKTYAYVDGRLNKIFNEKPGSKKYIEREYIYDSYGKLTLEKWINKSSEKYSTKKFNYDNRGNAIEIKSYYAAYNFNEDVKITYNFY